MNLVDVAILVFALFFGLVGIARGVVREVLGIFRWAAVAAVTGKALPFIKPFIIQNIIQNEAAASVISVLFVALVSALLFTALVHAISASVHKSDLGGFNRMCGGFFGIAKAFFFLACINTVGMTFQPLDKYPDIFRSSKAFPYVLYLSNYLLNNVFPDAFKNMTLSDIEGGTVAMKMIENFHNK